MDHPLVSIITVTYNAENCIKRCLNSIAQQTYPNIEHIVVDGQSADDTVNIIRQSHASHPIKIKVEPDSGIYDALNKGIREANGEIIGVLHADDVFACNYVIETVVNHFCSDTKLDGVYGNLDYIRYEPIRKPVRRWVSSSFNLKKLKYGWMPPHPTLFLRSRAYQNIGEFNTGFKISGDYEFMLRFFSSSPKTQYINRTFTHMATGGTSNRSLTNILLKTREDYRALKEHNLWPGFALVNKNLSKLPQLFNARPQCRRRQ